MKIIRFVLFAMLCQPILSFAQPTNIEQAIAFLQKACVTGGSSMSLELVATGNGLFQLKNSDERVSAEKITLTKKELEGYVDQASALAAQQATEMRACMRPHNDKIIAALLANNSSSTPTSIEIQTDGNRFITAEFDILMAGLASKPFYRQSFTELLREVKLTPAKVRHYLDIAIENKMAGEFNTQIDGYVTGGCPCFQITKKGNVYIVNRAN